MRELNVDTERARRTLWVGVMYEGPWEKIMSWLYRIDPVTLELKAEVPEGSLRDRLAEFCDRRDRAWRTRWTLRGQPPARWKRHSS